MSKHKCTGYNGSCCCCEGIIHYPLCTSKMKAKKDCCPARHILLHEQGQTRGIGDNSLPMLDNEDIQKYIVEKQKPKNTWYE